MSAPNICFHGEVRKISIIFLLMEVLNLELYVGIYHGKMRWVFRGFCSGHFIILLILMVIK